MKPPDKPTEQKITKQWAVQVDLGDHALDEFHSRIPRMAHKVHLDNPVFLVIQCVFCPKLVVHPHCEYSCGECSPKGIWLIPGTILAWGYR